MQSIKECRSAGVRVIVITGDSKATAQSICREIGVFSQSEDVTQLSFTGQEFQELSEAKQANALASGGGLVVSRAEPGDKQHIVRLLRTRNDVVAMTGDGVNDAPALKLADIGIAMGITGSSTQKESFMIDVPTGEASTILVTCSYCRH